MRDSDYLTLLCDARDALRAVIDRTDPKTGAQLHRAYREVSWCVQRFEQGKRGKTPWPHRTPKEG